MGLGDKIINDLDMCSQTSKDKIAEIFRKEYKGSSAFLLDFVLPTKDLGVHQLDITTIRMPNGDFQVLSCLLWAECSGDTSHYTSAGFTIDVETETIASKLHQYVAYFNKPGNEHYIGRKIPGV